MNQSKKCSRCKIIKLLSEFYNDKRHTDKKCSECKLCNNKVGRDWYNHNLVQYNLMIQNWKKRNKKKVKQISKNHYKAHKKYYLEKCIRYQLGKQNRTPKWANLEKIKEIYLKCPKGKVVDHIVPLHGKIVSGLHVHNNLQYLTPKQNLKKNNKYD